MMSASQETSWFPIGLKSFLHTAGIVRKAILEHGVLSYLLIKNVRSGKHSSSYPFEVVICEQTNMISRYLFRDDVLIATGTSMRTFDEVSKKDDRMLAMRHPIVGHEFPWSSYRMAWFIDNTWGWSPMPEEETARLRALLLLQQ